MKNRAGGLESGFTLVEVLMVLAIIGALASIALPHYLTSRVTALAVSCQSNRRHIEESESAGYLINKTPGLAIDEKWKCPSGGVYVWLVSDPEDPDYPRWAVRSILPGCRPSIPAGMISIWTPRRWTSR